MRAKKKMMKMIVKVKRWMMKMRRASRLKTMSKWNHLRVLKYHLLILSQVVMKMPILMDSYILTNLTHSSVAREKELSNR